MSTAAPRLRQSNGLESISTITDQRVQVMISPRTYEESFGAGSFKNIARQILSIDGIRAVTLNCMDLRMNDPETAHLFSRAVMSEMIRSKLTPSLFNAFEKAAKNSDPKNCWLLSQLRISASIATSPESWPIVKAALEAYTAEA